MTHPTTSLDVALPGGRVLCPHDSGVDGPVVVWHHGTPQSGALLAPLVAATRERGLRLVSYGRPGYGGSTPVPDRSVATAADDIAAIADRLGIARFAVMGASGGGPHALACAALARARVGGAVTLGGIASRDADADAWLAGIHDPSALRAALVSRTERERHQETAEFDPECFTAADHAALAGPWAALAADAGPAGEAWPAAVIDDDLALARPWGFDPGAVTCPVLLVQGEEDRVVPHAHMLRARIGHAELWLRPRDGHVSVLEAAAVALDWLRAEGAFAA